MKSPAPSEEDARMAAETLALGALAFLAESPERLGRFLVSCGIGPRELKAHASDPALLGGVLDHLTGDERLLRAFAEARNLSPEEIVQARRHLPGAPLPE